MACAGPILHIADSGVHGLSTLLLIDFRALKDRKAALPPAQITLLALGRAVPVYTDADLIDFKVCAVNRCQHDTTLKHAAVLHRHWSNTALLLMGLNSAQFSVT